MIFVYDLVISNAKVITLGEPGTLEKGFVAIKDQKIAAVGEGCPSHQAKTCIDAQGMVVMPGLVDCHTHLMEYATAEVHQTQGAAQKMAGVANLLTALKAGIVAVGEHHLGHPVLAQTTQEYFELKKNLPIDVKVATGYCIIGTDPLTLTSSTRAGQVLAEEDLTIEDIEEMARNSEFPGEILFLNATVANLPLEAAPRAGEVTISPDKLGEIIHIFHSYGKKIGAHIEGDEAAALFIEKGGNVIHHGHGVSLDLAPDMAERGVSLVITPHAGTSSRPTSPQEVFAFYQEGVKIALASDAYIPVHPQAPWIDLPPGYVVGPEDFLKIAQPILTYFLEQGVSLEESLKLITINGREILSGEENQGCIQEGQGADLIICAKIPGIETTEVEDIKYVIKDGKIVVQR